MKWISVEEALPNDCEFVIGMRADGWWDKIQWSHNYGWYTARTGRQLIVKWCRVEG